jgi:DNA modification methylase
MSEWKSPPSQEPLLQDEIDERKTKGLTVEALHKSKHRRLSMINKYGFVPTSILKREPREQVNVDVTDDEFIRDRGGGYERHNKEMRKVIRDLGEGYVPYLEQSGLRIQGRRGYLSRFPQSVGSILIDIYCPINGVVYDPFAGHNSRMQLCFRMNRDYIGVDCCAEYMRLNRALCDKLVYTAKDAYESGMRERVPSIRLIEGSSHKVDLPSNYADFTITSPPYWDLEYYGPEEEQLGNHKNYDDFLESLYPHIVENERILKEGAYCIWCINDFRRNKMFYPYHIDLFKRFEDAGFLPFNIYIIDLVSVVQASFVRDIEEHKIIPKQHEYILVFKKRGGTNESRKRKIVRRTG